MEFVSVPMVRNAMVKINDIPKIVPGAFPAVVESVD